MKTITRKELYDKIWSITKSKTAKELNLNFAELTKICKDHNIPTPSSRYWQMLSWGEKVEQTPLPDSDSDTVISLSPEESPTTPLSRETVTKDQRKQPTEQSTFYSSALDAELEKARGEQKRKKLMRDATAGKFAIDLQQPVETWMAKAVEVVRIFRVPELLKSRREITLTTKAYFRLNRLPYYAQMDHPDYKRLQTHLRIDVSDSLNDRALRVFDTLINIYEALGGQMKYEMYDSHVLFGDTKISVSITERNRRVERSPEEQRYGSKYDSVATGMLRIKLEYRWNNYKIEDTEYTKIEDKLDVVVRKTLDFVKEDLDRKEHARLAEIERRKKEEERLREEERQRQLERLREEERNEVRRSLNILRREMIVAMIDDLLSRNSIGGAG